MPSPHLCRFTQAVALSLGLSLTLSACVDRPATSQQAGSAAPPASTAYELVFPRDAGHLHLKRDFGAKGDGVTDDTVAFQRALAKNSGHLVSTVMYLDEGTYLVSGTLSWFCRVALIGRHRDAVVIKLKDNNPGFQNPNNPRPVIAVGNSHPTGDAMQSYVSNLTIDTGKGNPGAVGLTYQSNNGGTVEDVIIRSGDGRGATGFNNWPWPGPALVKNLRIEGFDRGIETGPGEYQLTFVDITLVGQREVGWHNHGLPIQIENLQSYNSVPALRGGGHVIMIDSELHGRDRKRLALNHSGDTLYLRNVKAPGYSAVSTDTGRTNEVREYWRGGPHSLFPSPRASLNLPVKVAPVAPYPPPETWRNVRDFKIEGQESWSRAIQAAIDSGAETLYFPNQGNVRGDGAYDLDEPVIFRGNVTRVIGMRSMLRIPKRLVDTPMVRFEGTSQTPLIVEYLDGGSEEYRLFTLSFHQAGSQPVVLRHSYGSLSNEPNAGDVYLDDFQGWVRLKGPINVWARSLNIETEGDIPELVNDGGTAWLLGFKTEYQSTNIWNKNGARTEMLGGLIYPVTENHPHIPAFINDESKMSLMFAYRVFTPRAHQNVLVREVRGGQVRELTKEKAFGGGADSSLSYTGYAE